MTTNVQNFEFDDQREQVNQDVVQDERQSEQMEISEDGRAFLHQCIIYFMQLLMQINYMQQHQSTTTIHESVHIAHMLCEIDESISECENKIRSYQQSIYFTRIEFNKLRNQLTNSNNNCNIVASINQQKFINLNNQLRKFEKTLDETKIKINNLNMQKNDYL